MNVTATIQGKPVLYHDIRKVINLHSGFKEKLLCDGPTFSLGTGCVYSCAFCYVPAMMVKLPAVQEAMVTHKKAHHELVLRRTDAVKRMEEQLLDTKGRPKFKAEGDRRVIYSSPLVDVAANVELAKETVEACKLILSLTNWQIRLLSKSNLLPFIAEHLGDAGRARVIYGVSTGTLDDNLARVIEGGTPLVSKRIESLHSLQDDGYRTFGMICPSLPCDDYEAFSRDITQAIRTDKCEHVWAEVINVRGESMTRTCAALDGAGLHREAAALREVSGDTGKWEAYSRATFLAHKVTVSGTKLRFLQYLTQSNAPWWETYANSGAVLLGAQASKPETAI